VLVDAIPHHSPEAITMKFSVTVTITAEQVIEIEASDEHEAAKTAIDLFDFDEAEIIESDSQATELE
jgi:ribosome-associated translation inhibitor RaiA